MDELLLLVLGGFVIFGIFFFLVGFATYILGAIGLMKVAERCDVQNGWLAFIPYANLWVMGEVVKDRLPESYRQHAGFLLLGATAVAFVLSLIPYIGFLFNIAYVAIMFYVMYKIFAKFSEKAVLMTVFTFISLGLLWGVFMFSIRNNPIRSEQTVVEEGNATF